MHAAAEVTFDHGRTVRHRLKMFSGNPIYDEGQFDRLRGDDHGQYSRRGSDPICRAA